MVRRALFALAFVLFATLTWAQQTSTDGELLRTMEDYPNGTFEQRNYLIAADGKHYALKFKTPPGHFQSGQRIRVKGHLRKPVAGELAIDNRAGVIEDSEVEAMALYPVANTLGEQRTLVILATFTDSTSPSISSSGAATVMASVNQWELGNSFQQTWLATSVVGPYQIPLSRNVCDPISVMNLAEAAANTAGIPVSTYARIVIAHPQNACGWWGLGNLSATPALINGSFTLKVVAHEMLGHNFGLWHSNGCNVSGMTATVDCVQTEYADPICMMGQFGEGEFQPFQKAKLGFIGFGVSPALQLVTASGTYPLDTYTGAWTSANGPKALRIQIGVGTGFYYYVSRLGANWYVHRGNDDYFSIPNAAVMMMGGPFRPNLPVGSQWTDPRYGITFQPVDGTKIAVTIGGVPPPVTPPPPLLCTDATALNGPTATTPGGPLPCVYPTPPPPGPCSYSVSPTAMTFNWKGGTGKVTVATGPGCTWTLTTSSTWMTSTTGIGSGSGTATFRVARNSATDRSGVVTVAGQGIAVTQSNK